MKHSLRWRFILPLLFFFIVVFVGISIYFSQTFLTIYEGHLRDTLASEAALFANDLSQADGYPNSISDLQSRVNHFGSTLQVRVTVIRPDGVVLGDSEADAKTMENHLTRPEVQQVLNGTLGYQIRYSATLKTELLYVAIPVVQNGKTVLIVRLARSLESIEAELLGLNKTILIAGVIALLLLLGITFWIFQNTVKPLFRLSKAAKEFSEGNFHYVSFSKSGNEVDQLAQAFDNMATQIITQIDTLKNEKGKLSKILDQMQDGVVIVDNRGDLQSLNPAAERMFAIKAENTIGNPLIQAIQYYQIAELYTKTLNTGVQNSTTFDLQPSHRYLQGIGSVMRDPNGDSVLLLFQDISKQRQLEIIRKDFVSNVSHELRTPLASLRALAETLQSGAMEDKPAAKRFIELMEIEIEKLTQMVDELLQLSRIESGRVPLKREPCQVKDLIKEPVSRMTLQADRAGISLVQNVPDNLPEINVDREQIEQVLINLIHNAIKFTPPSGTVTVGASGEQHQIIFRVKDTGIGISEEDLPRIFERFYKTDRARTTKGTGLGLSIAKHVIEAHGGKIWVESDEGQGSIFYFSIPFGQ